jgi:hypothetical protein
MVEGLSTLHLPRHLSMRKRTGARFLLVLGLVLRLGDFDDHVGHDIPCVADAHDHEQQRCRSDDEQSQYRRDGEQNPPDEKGAVRARA